MINSKVYFFLLRERPSFDFDTCEDSPDLTLSFSLPKNCALVEKDEGQCYAPLFSAVRLTGITDSKWFYCIYNIVFSCKIYVKDRRKEILQLLFIRPLHRMFTIKLYINFSYDTRFKIAEYFMILNCIF